MKYNIVIIISLLSFFSCKREVKDIEIDSNKNKIDQLLRRYSELNRFSGTVLIKKNDSIYYNSSYGFADYENQKAFTYKTAFKIGAISELITKDIIKNLANSGKLKLDDSISKYIPQLTSKYTINDLLNHKTDFPTIEALGEKNPELEYQTITFTNLVNDSITPNHNSNLNYNLLGIIIENISKKSFQENIEDYSNILGLKNTFYKKSESEIAVGYQYHNYRNKGLELQQTSAYNLDIAFSSRGLKSTAKDLMRILNRTSKDSININGYTNKDGFSYSLQNNPENGTCIIVLNNFRQPITNEISNSIESILENESYRLPLARKPITIDKNILNNYTGHYALNDYVKFQVIARNDSLFAILGPNETYLIPQSDNQFYMEDRDAAIRFLRDTSNDINSVELLDGFINGQIASRITE